MRGSAQMFWGLLLALVVVLLPAGAGAAEIQRWALRDGVGRGIGAVAVVGEPALQLEQPAQACLAIAGGLEQSGFGGFDGLQMHAAVPGAEAALR